MKIFVYVIVFEVTQSTRKKTTTTKLLIQQKCLSIPQALFTEESFKITNDITDECEKNVDPILEEIVC